MKETKMSRKPKEILNEMGQLLNKQSKYPFTVWIYSEDHEPPHFHLYNKRTNELITKIIITTDLPKTDDDIKEVKGCSELTTSMKKMILEWANSENKRHIPYWYAALDLWEQLHPED